MSPKAVESPIRLRSMGLSRRGSGELTETYQVRTKTPGVYRGKMVEAAGVEPYQAVSSKLVKARDFWS